MYINIHPSTYDMHVQIIFSKHFSGIHVQYILQNKLPMTYVILFMPHKPYK